MRKNLRLKQAVSEVIGVFLLLGITVSLFALLNYSVFHFSFNPSVTSVDLIGTIDKTNNVIKVEHDGGEPLEENMNIIITIGSHVYQNTSNKLLVDTNTDSKWNFGEIAQFHAPESLVNKYVRVEVVDPVKNTVLLSIVLQQGSS